MASTVDVHFQDAFRADFEMIYQQMKSRLFNTVRVERQDVENQFYNFIGALDDDDDVTTTRHGDTVWSEVEHTRRRLTLLSKDKALPLDKHDKKMMGPYDPSNGYVQALTAYFGRWVDRLILKAMGGVAYTGRDGSTSVNNYDVGESRLMASDGTWITAGSDFSAKTETGLTMAKLVALGEQMDDDNVPDDGERHLAVNSKQISAMLLDTTFGAEEIKAIRDISTRNVGRLFGFQMHVLPSDQFEDDSVSDNSIETYAWHRDAVVLATGTGSYGPEILISERNDKKHTKQIFAQMYANATRLQGPGVIELLLKKA